MFHHPRLSGIGQDFPNHAGVSDSYPCLSEPIETLAQFGQHDQQELRPPAARPYPVTDEGAMPNRTRLKRRGEPQAPSPGVALRCGGPAHDVDRFHRRTAVASGRAPVNGAAVSTRHSLGITALGG